MPRYEYRCRTCDTVFEERRPMSRSAEPATCPEGHEGAVRLLSVFASVGTGETAGPATAPSAGPCGSACGCHGGR